MKINMIPTSVRRPTHFWTNFHYIDDVIGVNLVLIPL